MVLAQHYWKALTVSCWVQLQVLAVQQQFIRLIWSKLECRINEQAVCWAKWRTRTVSIVSRRWSSLKVRILGVTRSDSTFLQDFWDFIEVYFRRLLALHQVNIWGVFGIKELGFFKTNILSTLFFRESHQTDYERLCPRQTLNRRPNFIDE